MRVRLYHGTTLSAWLTQGARRHHRSRIYHPIRYFSSLPAQSEEKLGMGENLGHGFPLTPQIICLHKTCKALLLVCIYLYVCMYVHSAACPDCSLPVEQSGLSTCRAVRAPGDPIFVGVAFEIHDNTRNMLLENRFQTLDVINFDNILQRRKKKIKRKKERKERKKKSG